MSLVVWLPLNGNLDNQGLSDITVTNNGATVDNNGKIGKCYSFNGSNAYLTFSSSVSLSNNFSICCWLDLTNINSTQYFIQFGNGGIRYSNSDNSFLYYSNSQTLTWTYTKVNRFVHVTFTCKSNSISLYIDGMQIGSNASLTGGANTCTGIGRRSDGYYYNGKINDFRIYDHCLSQKEVKEISKALILHYKLNDENTTNLLTYSNLQGHGSSWTLLENTFDGTPIYRNVVTNPNTGNNAGFSIRNIITNSKLSSATKVTLSFYKKLNTVYGKNLGGYLRVVKSDDTEATYSWSYNKANWANDSSTIGIWDYIYSTVTIPSGCTQIKNMYVYVDNATGGSCDFAKIQLELKDHATPYVDGIRSDELIYDYSGYKNNGIASGILSINNDSPRYNNSIKYTTNSCSIFIGNLSLLTPSKIFTFNIWFKKITGEWSSKSWETIFGGPGGFEFQSKRSSTNSPVLVAYSWGQSGSGGQEYSLDTWNMLTIVRTTSNSKFYLNGELYYTGSAGSIPSGNYYIGSWRDEFSQNYKGYFSDARLYVTELTAEEVKELYNTSASIDNTGNLFTYQLEEI